jgi:hypothetical protein
MGATADDPGPSAPAVGSPAAAPRGRSWSRAALLGAALAGAALACLALTAAVPGSLDDAFVVLVDARHLATEGGYRIDVDGRPVDGSTSPLDVLQKAALIAAGVPDALAAAGWLGLLWLAVAAGAAGALALGLARRGERQATAERGTGRGGALAPWALVAAAALAPGVVEGTAYVLETPLFAAVWCALLATVAGGRARPAFALAAALPLVRPEGFVLGPAAWLLAARASGRSAAGVAGGSVALAVVLGAQLALHVACFGSPWPNSYYAKRSDSRVHELLDGLAYCAELLVSWPGLALGTALLVALWARRERANSSTSAAQAVERVAAARASRDLALLGLAAFAVVSASGGDAYRGARLLAPVTLALWLAAAAALPLTRGFGRALLVGAAGASAVIGLAPAFRAPVVAVRGIANGPVGLAEFAPDATFVAKVERALADAPEGPARALAHRHAQRFAWFAHGLRLRDLTGLTDREIARLPAPGPVRFGRDALDFAAELGVGAIHLDHRLWHPRGWWPEDVARGLSAAGLGGQFLGPPLPGPATVARLAERYVLATLEDAWGPGRHVNLLVRRDLSAGFRAAGFAVGE